ncbi:MAG: ATP-binding cassette domain-containing protein [Bacteroidia bacterium]
MPSRESAPAFPVIRCSDLSLRFKDRLLFEQLSFELPRGGFAYLVGPTGTGKSSLLRALYADIKPVAGEVWFDDTRVDTLDRKDIPFLRRRMGIVFQDYQLLPDRDVNDNILFALSACGWTGKMRMQQRCHEVLLQVGMTGRGYAMPHQLSGGEQQRVAIARALINHPLLLVADEPTGNLDPEAAARIMDIIHKIHYAGTAVLMATHEYQLIKDYPHRVLELYQNRLRDYERAEHFLQDYSKRIV